MYWICRCKCKGKMASKLRGTLAFKMILMSCGYDLEKQVLFHRELSFHPYKDGMGTAVCWIALQKELCSRAVPCMLLCRMYGLILLLCSAIAAPWFWLQQFKIWRTAVAIMRKPGNVLSGGRVTRMSLALGSKDGDDETRLLQTKWSFHVPARNRPVQH